MNEVYPFKLIPLPYGYGDLEPYIDEKTVRIHHDKHLKTYVDNLNNVLEKYPQFQSFTLTKILYNINSFPEDIKTKIRNNAGGVFNHNFYFNIIGKNVVNKPIGKVEEAIKKRFGSVDNFNEKFKAKALEVFGSGYAWLIIDVNGNLEIITTSNQNTPLELNLYPILLIDVWEHAYYLKYQNLRAEYIDNFMKIIDWTKVENNYNNFFKY